MAIQSKVEATNWQEFIINLFVGTRKKQFISGAVLVIIAFLIHIRNLQGSTDNIKLRPRDKDSKKKV